MSATRPSPSNAAMEQPVFGETMPRSGRYGRSGVNRASLASPARPSAIPRTRTKRSRSYSFVANSRPVVAIAASSCAQKRSCSDGPIGPAILAIFVFWTGTVLNAATVLAGALIGTGLGDHLPERLRENVVRGVGLFTLAMGAKFAIDTANLLYLLGAILVGGIVGSLLRLDERLVALGDSLQRRFGGGSSTVSEAFVTSTIVFCVGPLTFLGSIRNGLTGDASLLAIKSVLDGFTSIALAATLGWGVLLTIPLILLYQGGLALGASAFAGLLSDLQLREMSAVGGLLIIGVGLKLLNIRDVKVADYLPAILVAPLLVAAGVRIKEAGAL